MCDRRRFSRPTVCRPCGGAKNVTRRKHVLHVVPSPPERASGGRRGSGSRQPEIVVDWSELMARAQSGDGNSYRYLLNDISPYLRSLAASRLRSPEDIEDAVQDIVLTIHKLRHTYDPLRPFGPWLVTIARRRIIDRYRSISRQGRVRYGAAEYGETFSADAANKMERDTESHFVRRAVEELPPGQREAIRLLKLEEMSLREASEVSGMSISALKVATHRAIKNLRKIILGRDN